MELNKIYLGDAFEILKTFPSNCVDAVVTDPPYALINESGSGFMGQEWDSFNYRTEEVYLFEVELSWFRKFAKIVEEYLRQNMTEVSLDVESFAPKNVNTSIYQKHEEKERNSNVQCVAKNSIDHQAELEKHKLFIAHASVLTREEVLVLQNELSLNLISEGKNRGNVLYVVGSSIQRRRHKNTVREDALKRHIASICEGRIIPLTSMDEAKIKGAIEEMIGKKLDEKYMKEIIGRVNCVERDAVEKRYNVTILSRIKLLMIILRAISSRYALNVTPLSKISIIKFKGIIRPPTNFAEFLIGLDTKLEFRIKTKLELYQLWTYHWAKEVIRVLKPGGHILVFGGTRTYHRMVSGLEDAGFEIRDMIQWLYSSGFPKSLNIGKLILKEIEKQLRQQGVEGEIIWK